MRRALLASDAARNLQSVHARQRQVENHEVVGLREQHRGGMIATRDRVNDESGMPQGLGNTDGQVDMVFDQQ